MENQVVAKRRVRLSKAGARAALSLVWALGAGVGCGDDDKEAREPGELADAGSTVEDAGSGDPLDAGDTTDPDPDEGRPVDVDAGVDAAVPPPAPLSEVFADTVPLVADQADRLFAVAFGNDGKLYAAGFTTTVTDTFVDRQMAVARFDLTGKLDTTFGTAGVATVVLAAGAADITETARGIGVQADGKIVVVGHVRTGEVPTTIGEVTGNAPEIDIAVARFGRRRWQARRRRARLHVRGGNVRRQHR